MNKLNNLEGDLENKIKPKWQKKKEKSMNMSNSTSNFSFSYNNASLVLGNSTINQTPNKQKAENGNKNEKKSPSKLSFKQKK